MAFDLYGFSPKSEKGEYFRNTIGGWDPLADFVLDHVEIPERDREEWHANDGYEISAASARRIAVILEKLIAEGIVAQYEKKNQKHFASLQFDFDEANVKEFMEFCRDSGGFVIY